MTDPQDSRHRDHRLRRSTGELPHEEKIKRQERHLQILTVAMLLVLAMLVYTALSDLDSWPEWVVFGAICATAVGAIIAVSTQG